MKKLLALILGLVMLVSILAACSNSSNQQSVSSPPQNTSSSEPEPADTSSDKQPVLGVSLYFLRDEYYRGMEQGFRTAAEEFGFDIIIMDADTDVATQTQQIEDFIAMQVDFIALAPCDPDAMEPVLLRAMQAGIPVIIFDGNLNNDDAFATGMIMDFRASGRAVGDWTANYINEELGGVAKVAVIEFAASPVVGAARAAGFLDAVEAMPGVEIVAKQDGGGDRAVSMTVMENILTANPDVDIVYGVTSGSGFGAASALESAGNPNGTIVVTYGYGLESFSSLADRHPIIKAFACDLPQQQARGVVNSAYKILNGESVEKRQPLSFSVFDQNNIDDFDWKSALGQ